METKKMASQKKNWGVDIFRHFVVSRIFSNNVLFPNVILNFI